MTPHPAKVLTLHKLPKRLFYSPPLNTNIGRKPLKIMPFLDWLGTLGSTSDLSESALRKYSDLVVTSQHFWIPQLDIYY